MSKLMELVEEYGALMVGYAFGGKLSDGDPVLAKIRDAVQELERIEAAARVYATRYAQDEAEDSTICSERQHLAAKELIDALSAIKPIRAVWHDKASEQK